MNAENRDRKSPRDAEASEERGGSAYPLIIAGIVVIGAVLVFSTGFSGGRYSLKISDVTGGQSQYEGKDLKVVGKIKEGSSSTVRNGNVIELRFSVHDGNGHEVPVVYPRNPPDPFKEGRECIVEGILQPDGSILAHKLTVKCPSKYQNEDGGYDVDPKRMDEYRKKYGSPPPQGVANPS